MKTSCWAYYTPEFECDKFNTEMLKYSPWSGHRRFAYDLVASFKPELIVELGSYYGCSAFSFLQAIKDFSLESEFFGIDTWNGDGFTSEDYQEDIYSAYKNVQDHCFLDSYAHMLRMTFDEAVAEFSDTSIDLLHIDGSHTYEDVKHDFYTWKRKVKSTGIILFHDISEDKLFGEVMGSHVFWNEIKAAFPYTLEFPYSFGLGVLFFDQKTYRNFKDTVSLNYYQQLVNHNDVLHKDVIRKDFFEKRDLKRNIKFLENQVQISQEHLREYAKSVSEKNDYIRQLEERIEELTNKCRNTYSESLSAIKDYEEDIKKISQLVVKKDQYIEELKQVIEQFDLDQKKKEKYIEELKIGIEKYSADEKVQKEYIAQLEKTIQELNEAIVKYQNDINTIRSFLEGEKQDYKNTLQGKEKYIEELELAIDNLNRLIADKDRYVSELKDAILSYENTCSKKDEYINELKQVIEEYKNTVEGKEAYITELLGVIEKYQKTTEGKDQFIAELQETIEKYKSTLRGKDEYIKELEAKTICIENEKHNLEVYVSELKKRIEIITESFELCSKELEEVKNLYQLLLKKQSELEHENIDLQKSIENTYEVLERYKKEMSQSIIGRHFIKKVEKKNEQS